MTELIRDNLQQIEGLCERFGVRSLEVFGSAADGPFDLARSDVDLLVEFRRMPTLNVAQQYFGLLHGLETVLGRKVDLLMPRALRNPYLIRSINATRKPLYAA